MRGGWSGYCRKMDTPLSGKIVGFAHMGGNDVGASAVAVITGQVRDRANLGGLLSALREIQPRIRIVLSTWSDELIDVDLQSLFKSRGVEVIQSTPIASDLRHNVLRQQAVLEAALNAVEPDEIVVKLRTDWVSSAESLSAQIRACRNVPPGPTAMLLGMRGRIVVPWWNPQIPYRIADESFVGLAADLRLINKFPPLPSLVDVHIARFGAPAQELESFRNYLQLVIQPLARCQTRKDPFAKDFALRHGLPTGSFLRWVQPGTHEYARRCMFLPSVQIALADYHMVMRDCFAVVNLHPEGENFISGVGGPWSDNGYVEASDTLDFWNHESFVVAYGRDTREVIQSFRNNRVRWHYRSRVVAIEANPEAILSAPSMVRRDRVCAFVVYWRLVMKGLFSPISWRQRIGIARGRFMNSLA